MLAFNKPGIIYLWRAVEDTAAWHGLRSIVLKTQNISTGSTSLAPVSGIDYIRSQDVLVVSLSDGSFHAIQEVSVQPRLVDQDASLSSQGLSSAARQCFVAVEEEGMKKIDVNCTHGMTTFDGDSYFVWIHE